MSNRFGDKYQVASYIPETVLINIDYARGDKSRSAFIGEVLTSMFSTEGTAISNR